MLFRSIIYSTKFKAFHWSITSARKRVIVGIEVIECNTKVAMETMGEARNLNTKSKMADCRFVSSDEIVVDQLKLNAKKQKHD